MMTENPREVIMATGSVPSSPLTDEFCPAECLPRYDKLVTEDDKPVDNLYSERQHVLLTTSLIESWPGPGEGRPFLVASDVGLFFSDTEPPFAPDVLLSLDVSPPRKDFHLKENRSYYIWKYVKAPDALIEIVSNTEGGELATKLKGYARLRATYYVVWDPFLFLGDKNLYCFALEQGKYNPCEPWFPELDLGVKTWDGIYGAMPATFLRWCDRQGQVIPTGAERAEQEKQRAGRLADRLRSLGIDPEKP